MIYSIANLRKHGDKIALIHYLGQDRQTEMTFDQLSRLSAQLAHQLLLRGLKSGQFVGIYMQRSPLHIAAMLAIHHCGGAFFSLNPKLSPQQVQFSSRLCRAPLLLIDQHALLRLANLEGDQLDSTKIELAITENLKPLHASILAKVDQKFPIEVLTLDLQAPLPPEIQLPRITPHDVALALFTSGSTGTPKGVMISHQDLQNRVATECRDFRLQPSDRLLSLLPFSFDVGLNQLFTTLSTGISLVILNSWLPDDICAVVEKLGITGISGVPNIWGEMLAYDENKVRACFSRLRYFTISGGGMAHSQLTRLRELAPNTAIYKTYGQTEAFRSGILFPEAFGLKMDSVGKAVAGTDVFVITGKGKLAQTDEIGQIIHRGDGSMLGYIADPKSTRQKLRRHPLQNESVLHPQRVVYTGDLGKIDADGYIYVTGRIDKMLKIRGNRVYPKEIEEALLACDAVQEAIVVGIKDSCGETRLYAEVRFKSNHSLNEEELKRFLSQRIPSYMLPSRISCVDSFPRTPSGKIKLGDIEEKYRE
ncbi:AMP-binding protein [candidate division KSB1 bacterium]|nr:AMP-binding protein [candidate division KSB1 bacterium]